jgi:hypothetical protein
VAPEPALDFSSLHPTRPLEIDAPEPGGYTEATKATRDTFGDDLSRVVECPWPQRDGSKRKQVRERLLSNPKLYAKEADERV